MDLAVGFNPRLGSKFAFRRVATNESIQDISFIVIDAVKSQKRNVFVLECLLFVMLPLILDVINDVRNIRFANAEYSIAVLPRELPVCLIHPFRRFTFEPLSDLARRMGWL